jgi:hypothetical protein
MHRNSVPMDRRSGVRMDRASASMTDRRGRLDRTTGDGRRKIRVVRCGGYPCPKTSIRVILTLPYAVICGH